MPVADFASLLRRAIGLDAASIGTSAIESAVKIRMRACKLKDSAAYWGLLQSSEPEVQELIEAVIVPETWFFRETAAFPALTGRVMSQWLPANPAGKLRLLSLPCSTGEEPYSIAMSLLETGLPPGMFQIDAVDISTRSLERAHRGIYGANSFRGRDVAYRERYFEPAERGFRVSDRVRQQVRFMHSNMLDPQFMPGQSVYDFIFCRNVLIYFDQGAQDQAVRMLDRLLKPDGMLFIGPSESGLLMSHGYVSAQIPRAFAFHRKPVTRHKPAAAAPVLPLPPRPKVVAPTVVKAAKPAGKPEVKPRLAPPLPATASDPLDEVAILADQGRLSEAMQRCDDILRSNGPSARAFYLMGLMQDARGKPADAERSYRKALYLEPGHHETIIHLALLLEQQGDSAGARQLHQRAKRVAAHA